MSGDQASVSVPCQVCGGRDFETVYEREFRSAALGRWQTRLSLCDHCGFLFANPRPTRGALERHYRGSHHASGAVFRELDPGSRQDRLDRTRRDFIRDHVQGTPGRALDVGCSTGHFLAALDLEGWERVGLEPSAQAAATARGQGFEVLEGTLEGDTAAAGLTPGSFGLVTLVSVLEHLWDVDQGIAAAARLLAPGGHLFLDVPHSLEPEAMISEYFAFEHLSHFTPASLRYLLARHGLEVEATRVREHSGLLVMARRSSSPTPVAPEELSDTRERLRATVLRYRAERRSLEEGLRAQFEDRIARWRTTGSRVAIYGAGEHTHFLLDLVDLADSVALVLDSDPGKWGTRFRDWTVHSPDQLQDLELDAVVISSRPFQEEIAASLEARLAGAELELVRCYPELAPPEGQPAGV